jgi:hypothetical protein
LQKQWQGYRQQSTNRASVRNNGSSNGDGNRNSNGDENGNGDSNNNNADSNDDASRKATRTTHPGCALRLKTATLPWHSVLVVVRVRKKSD